MDFNIVCDSLVTYLPHTVNVKGYRVCVNDVHIPSIHNFPECFVNIKTDKDESVSLESGIYPTAETITAELREKLKDYAAIELDPSGHLVIECKENIKSIIFPSKLVAITGMVCNIEGLVVAKYPINPLAAVDRIFIVDSMVEPSIVGGGYLSYIYAGRNNSWSNVFHNVVIEELNLLKFTLLDSFFDEIVHGPGAMHISLKFEKS